MANPGAEMEPQNLEFLLTKAPVGRKERWKATQILRAGTIAKSNRYASPVMGAGADSPYQGEMARRARGGRDAVLWT